MSGGFAIVHPGNSLTINAVEAASLDKFSLEVSQMPSRWCGHGCTYSNEKCCCRFFAQWGRHPSKAIRQNLAEAQRVVAGSGSEEDKIEARIELEVYEALQHHVTS